MFTAHQQVEILLPAAFSHGFDYRVPEGMQLKPGDWVSVPFGRGTTIGAVWGKGTAKVEPAKLREVMLHHDQYPALSDAMRQYIDWAAWYNCAPKGMVLKMVLPIAEVMKGIKTRSSTLIETGLDIQAFKLPPLSPQQKAGAQSIEGKLGQGFSITLLDGVTGSGKTEVYYDAIARALKADSQAQVLLLLPEIGLSVQSIERFAKRFGATPLVWNSEITPARKRQIWQAIATGEARMVIGARSALFLPYRKLALLVVDEEHDASYKQEEGVIYHARDMAVARGRFEKLPVVLVSATPSLESYHNARQGKYAEVALPSRHAEASMPDIEMLDMRSVAVQRGSFVCDTLREAIKGAIAKGHQAMLFLNRRGYAPLLICRTCGHRFQCPDCSSWLVVHKSKPRLECHHCGYHMPMPKTCPECKTEENMFPCGPGVERLREEVQSFLPDARVAVLASDSTTNFAELEETITAMSEKRLDLLIGTQMIAKGHHFADLTVVGVVDADLGLAGGDLRAAERTYQLLHQLSGRAGRETERGHVYLQSYLPEHPVMKALTSGQRDAFMAAELAAREAAHMPPFSRLAAVIVEGAKEALVADVARKLASRAGGDKRIAVLGPAPAPLSLLRGKHRYRLLVRADRAVNLPDYMKAWLASVEPPSSVRVKLDIDPQSFM